MMLFMFVHPADKSSFSALTRIGQHVMVYPKESIEQNTMICPKDSIEQNVMIYTNENIEQHVMICPRTA